MTLSSKTLARSLSVSWLAAVRLPKARWAPGLAAKVLTPEMWLA